MRKLQRMAAIAFTAIALAAVACDRKEGPLEEAGEAIDDAVDEVHDRVDEMGEK